MSDVIADSPLIYTHAELTDYGYIRVKDEMWGHEDFHRDMTIDQFNAPLFDTLEDAIAELPHYDGEEFVMAFEKDGVCERLWFSELQKENDLLRRLNKYRECYGGYGTAIFKVG